MTADLAVTCNKAPEVAENNIAPEDEYEEPKWASIRDCDSSDASVVVVTPPATPSPLPLPRADKKRFGCATGSAIAKEVSLAILEEKNDVPVDFIAVNKVRRLYSINDLDRSNPVEFRCFYAIPELEGPRLLVRSPLMWECEVDHQDRFIWVTTYCDDIAIKERLWPVFQKRLWDRYPRPHWRCIFVETDMPRFSTFGDRLPHRAPVNAGSHSAGSANPSAAQKDGRLDNATSGLPMNIPLTGESQAPHPDPALVPSSPPFNMTVLAAAEPQYNVHLASHGTAKQIAPDPAWQHQGRIHPEWSPQSQPAAPGWRHLPEGRCVYQGRDGHEFIHADGQNVIYIKNTATGRGFYVDLKNVMIETRESIQPSIQTMLCDMEARGWTIKSCQCLKFEARFPGGITRWRTFISFSKCEHAAEALCHFGRRGRIGEVKFVWVDYHKPKKTLFEGAPPFAQGPFQQASSA